MLNLKIVSNKIMLELKSYFFYLNPNSVTQNLYNLIACGSNSICNDESQLPVNLKLFNYNPEDLSCYHSEKCYMDILCDRKYSATAGSIRSKCSWNGKWINHFNYCPLRCNSSWCLVFLLYLRLITYLKQEFFVITYFVF